MTPSALPNLVPSVGKSSTPVPSTSVAPGATSADADLFSTQLATSIAQATAKKAATAPAASATTAPSAPVDSSTALTALQTQIAAQLNAGQSLSSVTAQLASALATKVAAKLGVSTEDARKKLEAAFTAALSPPGSTAGTGPPLTTAQQALALAQTFLQTASVATGVATGESGQLNRFLGTDLDADQAKANPAPTTTTTPVTQLLQTRISPLLPSSPRRSVRPLPPKRRKATGAASRFRRASRQYRPAAPRCSAASSRALPSQPRLHPAYRHRRRLPLPRPRPQRAPRA